MKKGKMAKKGKPTEPAPTAPVTNVYINDVDLNIQASEPQCGLLVIEWDDYPKAERYAVHALESLTTCMPQNTTESVAYYWLGGGCTFFPHNTYNVVVTAYYREGDTNYYITSKPQEITTGKGKWECQ